MLPRLVLDSRLTQALSHLYGDDTAHVAAQHTRYMSLVRSFRDRFGSEPTHIYSSPGRCELGGNHTDHNGGLVLAGTINLDLIAAVAMSNEFAFTVYSAGYEEPFHVSLSALDPDPLENPTSQLLRGVASAFARRGHHLGGLRIFLHSEVLFASGLSSSAALEMLLASILNDLFGNSSLNVRELASIGQEAEHRFWQKPVGLLDQLTIGTGGVVHMSFRDSTCPLIESLRVDFESMGYSLLLGNPGGDHSHLTPDYRQVPIEMGNVAKFLGKRRLIELSLADIMSRLPELRQHAGDRAILRALHFFQENARVAHQVRALIRGEIADFLRLVNESGSSSWRLLQNVFAPTNITAQPLALALALAELQTQELGVQAAHRVHGGGFGGTILMIIPSRFSTAYQAKMHSAFGDSACHRLRIRPVGCVNVAALETSIGMSG